LLDPVYTGRAAAGLLDLVRKGFFERTETVLFLHTGGQPALFAERYADAFKRKPRLMVEKNLNKIVD
jgi:hypothetical protein